MRQASASQPPVKAPAMLASCANRVAPKPAMARLMLKRSCRNFGIQDSRTTATKLAQMKAPIRASEVGVRRIIRTAASAGTERAGCAISPESARSAAPRSGSRNPRRSARPRMIPRPPNTTNDHRHPYRCPISPAKKPPPTVPR